MKVLVADSGPLIALACSAHLDVLLAHQHSLLRFYVEPASGSGVDSPKVSAGETAIMRT
jgi:hypothetical protein